MFAICTRTKMHDYVFRGDVDEYEAFREKIISCNCFIDTTKPMVLFLEGELFVTGIATSRTDKINTPIRYSIYYKGNNAQDLFVRIKMAFQTNKASSLGNELDSICKINDVDNENPFICPKQLNFIRIVEKFPLTMDGVQVQNFALWTEFCPVEKNKQALDNFVNSKECKNLPTSGTIEIHGLEPINLERLKKKV